MVATLLHPSSYLGIALFLILTGCGMPIPEEVAIVIAGVLCAEGELLVGPALAACLIGAVLGDCILYSAGYHWGDSLLSMHPRLARWLSLRQEKRFEEAIDRHAFKAMFLARFMVGVRGPMYFAAGASGMPFRRFLLIDLVCATIVVTTVFGLSFTFGEEVMDWISRAERTATLAAGLLAAAVVLFLYFRYRRGREDVATRVE